MDRARAEQIVTELFDSWYPSVVRFASYSCHSTELAEEFAQEAFTSLYRNVRDDVLIEHPRAWVLQAVRNQISKHWRFRRRHREESLPEDECERLQPVVLPPSIAERPQASLADYLGVLSEREEETVLLRAKGLKYREIAAQMGISSNSVGTLMMRATQKIRKARDSVSVESSSAAVP